MSNGRKTLGKRPVTIGTKRRPIWLKGYADIRNMQAWDKDYDKWSMKDQKDYENGRLIATNIKSAGLKIPALRVNNTASFVAAYEISKEKVGIAHSVADRMPDDYELPVDYEPTIQVY